MLKLKNKDNLQASILLFFILILLQIIYSYLKPDFKINFGAEYGRIAEALVSGRGYSNPFGGETGPTAWMLPILVLIIAFVFTITGKTLVSFIILSAIKFFVYALSFYFVAETLSLTNQRKKIALLMMIFLLFFLFSPSQNFEMISDLWITVFIASFFIFSYFKYYIGNSISGYILLLVTFFISPLISPGFALGFLFIVSMKTINNLYLWIKQQKSPSRASIIQGNIFRLDKPPFKILFNYSGFILAFSFSLSLWVTRNYLVFEKIIPSKSNMWFEFYLTNVTDTDGQLSYSTSFRGHPNSLEYMRNEIKDAGEVAWVEKYHQKSKEFLKNNKGDYWRKVKFRLFNAFIYMENDMDFIISERWSAFAKEDKAILQDNLLMYENGWICLFYTEPQITGKLNDLHINNKELILEDWKNAKSKYQQDKYSLPNFFRSSMMSIVSLICLLTLLIIKTFRHNPLVQISSALYFIYLIPYIIVSHQIRYQRPLFILQVIFIYLLIAYFFQYLTIRKKGLSWLM